MSHHFSPNNWFKLFSKSLEERLPRNYSLFKYSYTSSRVYVQFARDSGKGLIPRGTVGKSICWTTCSPYLAASIFLNEFLKGRY